MQQQNEMTGKFLETRMQKKGFPLLVIQDRLSSAAETF